MSTQVAAIFIPRSTVARIVGHLTIRHADLSSVAERLAPEDAHGANAILSAARESLDLANQLLNAVVDSEAKGSS